MSTIAPLESSVEITTTEIGGTGRQLAHPRSEAELTALFADLRRARDAGSRIGAALLGRGSSVAWCSPTLWSANEGASDRTLWISTESLVPDGATGIVEYVPGDGTLTAQAGAHIETLRSAVKEGGHRITPAGPRAGSTLGGLLASGVSSLDRCTFGPTRHHVLGMRIQDASGRGPTRTGGRLVKNVTGFDLHRLHAGARGTLGAILEASLRLVPVPEAEVHVTSASFASAGDATAAALGLRANRTLQPRALFVVDRTVHLVLGGRARQVDVELTAALADLDVDTTSASENALESAFQAADRSGDQGAALVIATAPSHVESVVRQLDSVQLAPLHIEPDAARIEISLRSLHSSAQAFHGEVLPRLDPERVHVSLRRLAPEFNELQVALLARHPAPRAIIEWTKRLQASFDPLGILRSPDFPLPAATAP
ncbi:MAG: FAD/FMN-containing dehydrogenase [Paracoccaceae bacterium]|jgi:FAD/FMN-containing dehydrogenase